MTDAHLVHPPLLVLKMTVHLWPGFFPTHDISKELALQDCAMHKVSLASRSRPDLASIGAPPCHL
jgi:hypothetical protein